MAETWKRLDADRVFVALGKYGTYQMRSFICANVISVLLVFQVMQMAFVNDKPQFQCVQKNYNNTEIWNKTDDDSKCYLVVTDNNNNTKVKCGEENSIFVFDQQFGTSIVSEWNVVCDSFFRSSEFASSIFMFGVMCGATLVSQLSDTFGRRWIFLLSTWLLVAFSFLQGILPNYATFVICRFIIGIFYSGMGMVGWVVSCENVTVAMRSYLSIVGGMFWSFGYMVLGLLAYLVRDWRLLSLYLSIPGVLTISFYWLVPETLHWFIATLKEAEAENWIRKAEKCNKTKINLDECFALPPVDSDKTMNRPLQKRTFFHIFKSTILLPQYLTMCYLWICNTFVYFGLSLFSTKLSGDRYVNFILGGLVEIPSYFVAAWSMEKLGRRTTSVIFHAMAGVSLLTLLFVPKETEGGLNLLPLITCLSLIGKFAISVTFMVIFVYAAEIFPTTVRTVGIGSCSMMARIGAILAPYVGLLNDYNPKIVPAMFGVMALLAAAVTFLIVETRNQELPEDLCDVYPSKLQMILCPCLTRPKQAAPKSVER